MTGVDEGAWRGEDAAHEDDDDGDDDAAEIPGTGTADSGSAAVQVGTPEPAGSVTGEARRPSRSVVDRAPRRPSCRNGRPWSMARNRPHRKNTARETPARALASPIPRRESPPDTSHTVCCRTSCKKSNNNRGLA